MAEDLKLFGEVGLGYQQLIEDAKQINSIIKSIDTNVGKLGDNFSKKKLQLGVDLNEKNINDIKKELGNVFTEMNKEGTEANKSLNNITDGMNKLQDKVKNVQNVIKVTKKEIENIDTNKMIDSLLPKDMKKLREELRKTLEQDIKIPGMKFDSKDMVVEFRKQMSHGAKYTDEWIQKLENLKKSTILANSELEKLKAAEKELNKIKEKMSKNESINLRKQIKENDLLKDIKFSNSELKNTDTLLAAITKRYESLGKEQRNALTKISHSEDDLANHIRKQQEEELRKTSRTGSNHGYGIGTMAEFYAIERGIRAINNEIKEFEKGQIEVERIARNTSTVAKELVESTFEISRNTGIAVSQTQEVAGLWARAGREGKDLEEAMKTTVMGFNVAEFKDAETAVASLNAIINQMYEGDATKSPEILDAMVKIADKTAVRNVEDLAEVSSRAGANAASLGVSFHELNAISSIIMENMKVNGDVLGTQLKTIFSRMLNEGNLNKLEKMGIFLTETGADGTRKYKEFSQAFDEVVAQYNKLMAAGDEVGANKIMEIIGGTRQITVVKNLVKDWGKFDERVKMSLDSQGFAAEQNAEMMNSYAKKVDALKTSFTELAVGIGNGGLLDFLKLSTDGFSGLIEKINLLPNSVKLALASMSSFPILLTALEKAGNILTGRNSIFGMLSERTKRIFGDSDGFADGIDKSLGKFALFVPAMEKTTDATEKGGNAVKNFLKAFNGGTVTIGTLTTSLAKFATVAGGITIALGAAAIAWNKHQEEKARIIDGFVSGTSQKELDYINELKKQYDQLANNSDIYKEGTDKYREFAEVNESLSTKLGLTSRGIQTSTESMKAHNTIIESTLKLKEKEIELEEKKAKQYLNREFNKIGGINNTDVERKDAAYARALENLENAKRQGASQSVKDSLNLAKDNAFIEYQKSVLEFQNASISAGKTIDDVKEKVIGLKHGVPVWESLSNSANNLADSADNASIAVDGSAESIGNMGDSAEDATNELKELGEEFDALTSSLSVMDSAFDEYDENGFISPETVVKLVETMPELANYIEKVGDKYVLLAGIGNAYEDLTKGQIELTDAILESQRVASNPTSGASDFINRIVDMESINDVKYALSSLDDEVKNRIESIGNQFIAGQIPVEDYFGTLEQEIRNIDLSNLDTTQLANLNSAIESQLTSGILSLNAAFQNGTFTQDEYARRLEALRSKAQALYGAINGITNTGLSGVFRNSAGEVDELYKILSNTGTMMEHFTGVSENMVTGLENITATIDDTGDALISLGDQTFILDDFANNFYDTMANIRDNNTGLWEEIVVNTANALGMTQNEAINALLNVGAAGSDTQSMMNSALSTLAGNLSKSLAQSASSTTSTMNAMGNVVKGTNYKVTGNFRRGGEKRIKLGDIGGVLPIYANILDGWGFDITGSGSSGSAGPIAAAAGDIASARSPFQKVLNSAKMSGIRGANKGSKLLADYDKKYGSLAIDTLANPTIMMRELRNEKFSSIASNYASSIAGASKDYEQLQKNFRDKHGLGGGSGNKGGGGGKDSGKNSSKKEDKKDIPEEIQKQIDDLEHKVALDEISQYEYGKKLEKIFDKNKNLLTDKGIREMEKMIYDAKTGTSDESFEAQIENLEHLISMADTVIDSLEHEQKLLEVMGAGSDMLNQVEYKKMDLYSSKILSNEAVARKYRIAIEAIDKEINGLDKSSIGYSKTVENLSKKQDELKEKLAQTKNEVDKMKLALVEASNVMSQNKMNMFENAISNLEKNEQYALDIIDLRNSKWQEQMNKRHEEEREQLEKDNKIRDKNHQKEMERIQKESDKFRQHMEDKMKMLNRENEKEDYDDELKKRIEEINELERKIAELSLDDSYSAKGKVINLNEDLIKKKEELDKFQRDRERELKQQALQDQLTDHERALADKQSIMDSEYESEQEKYQKELELLEERQKKEREALEERMSDKQRYAEASLALTSGLVESIDGEMVSLTQAFKYYMDEMGLSASIMAEKIRLEFQAVNAELRNSMQVTGTGGLDNIGGLQALTGLTDESYKQYLAEVANMLGMTLGEDDVEGYILNKYKWQNASPEERKALEEANRLIRQKLVDRMGQGSNKDANGLVYSLEQLLAPANSGKYTKAQTSPKFSPIQGATMEEAEKYSSLLAMQKLYPDKLNEINSVLLRMREKNPALANYSYANIFGSDANAALESAKKGFQIYGKPGTPEEFNESLKYINSILNGDKEGASSALSDAEMMSQIKAAIPSNLAQYQKDFILSVAPGAIEGYKKYGVLPSVTIAQAILESGWGKSGLSSKYNNLFGIKANGNWTGKSVNLSTKEYGQGTIKDNFRVYDSISDSIEDHGKFLKENSRYANAGLFDATTAAGQAQALKKAGYATDPNYANKLINSYINPYNLTLFDNIAKKPSSPGGGNSQSGGGNSQYGTSSSKPIRPITTSGTRVSSEFGPRWGRNHNGIDIAAPIGTPVIATLGGIVTRLGNMGARGKAIYIQHADGSQAIYQHLNSYSVSKGQTVNQGQLIGTSGNTGKSTGPHLHFEFLVNGKPTNPRKFVPFREGGIADFTGPAMLHGTKTAPEYIFNTPQFEALGKLVAHYATAPSVAYAEPIQPNMTPTILLNIDNMVKVEGNATPETIESIRVASNDALKGLVKVLNKKGIKL